MDIRPGTYSVTFTLPGFNTFRRDGVDVPTNVSVPINAEMKVGASPDQFLAEVGCSSDILHYTSLYEPGIGQERGTAAWLAAASHYNPNTTFRTVAGQFNRWFYPNQDSAVASLSYVTGSHNIKTGMLWGFGSNGYVTDMNADLWQNYNTSGNGQIPVSVTVFNSPVNTFPELKTNVGLYVQDQWAIKRFTINDGIRYESTTTSTRSIRGRMPTGRP